MNKYHLEITAVKDEEETTESHEVTCAEEAALLELAIGARMAKADGQKLIKATITLIDEHAN